MKKKNYFLLSKSYICLMFQQKICMCEQILKQYYNQPENLLIEAKTA